MPEPVRRCLLSLLATAALVLASGAATADDYKSDRAGHPLRIAAYVLHPIGVVIDTLVLRPAHWIGSHEPFATLFGHETDE